jgi:DNA polymerase II small subunit/DNA polymerase delta subunit B
MNKSSLIKAKADFEASPYLMELKLSRNVAFIMYMNDRVNNLTTKLKEQKAMPTLNHNKINEVLSGLEELNLLVKSVFASTEKEPEVNVVP